MTPTPTTMTDAQIKHMVNRFLAWKLPETFGPNGGIKFERVGNVGTSYEFRREPVGTNLLTATEAEAMVKHMLEGLPPAPAPDDLRELREAAERASQGKWCQFHPTYCADAAGTPFSDWDSSHDMSALHEGRRKRIATFTHADDAAFVDAANPSTVLSLITRIARLESENARLREDKARLDWLDTVNIRVNERNGTVYGWKYDINHNRAALTDCNLPALTVREAIDAARFPEKASGITLHSVREQKRRADFRRDQEARAAVSGQKP